jgi:subtilisin family serine protease
LLLAGASVTLAVRAGAEAPPCGPFELASADVAQATTSEPGVAPAGPGGTIARLPDPVAIDGTAPAGEALLALPKTASGGLPTGIVLAPGAEIASSYWSPVLCATVARVVGPPDLAPAALVPGLPDGAAVTANSVYASAQADVQPLASPAASSADPYRPLQYALDQLGVERARPASNGAGVRVALLDSAPDVAHADLPRIEVASLEGGPAGPGAHGTLVAGVVAARERNGLGIAGVAPGASLLAVPVCTPQGSSASDRCLLYDLLRGVDLAYAREAGVMNLSLVGPDNPLLLRAMDRLDDLGVLVVAAAGNEGTSEPRYPAAYPSVIGVGAADRARAVYARSNRGLSAELYAPGVEVLSSVPGGSFAFGSGTSFAAAHVSGELAVLLGAGATPAQARTALFREANSASEGEDAVLLPPLCDVLARLGKACAP